MYRPSLGVWLSDDPSGFDGGQVNLYEFVGDNPVNRMDPSGLQSSSVVPKHVPYGPPSIKKFGPPKQDYLLPGTGSAKSPLSAYRTDLPGLESREFIYNGLNYLSFSVGGHLNGAYKRAPTATQTREIRWVVPIYPGKVLCFGKGGNYLGSPCEKFKPDTTKVNCITLAAGEGLVFSHQNPGGENEKSEGDHFVRKIKNPKDYQPKPGEYVIVVPQAPPK